MSDNEAQVEGRARMSEVTAFLWGLACGVWIMVAWNILS